MFEDIVRTLTQQAGLGNNARPFLQMLLARLSDPSQGGFGGLVQRLRDLGMGSTIDAWMTPAGMTTPAAPADIERAFGGTGLIGDLATRFGMDRTKVTSALGLAIPAIMSLLSKDGVMPAALPPDAASFMGSSAWNTPNPLPATPAATGRAPTTGWMPWIVAAILALLLLGYCTTKQRDDPVPVATQPVVTATEPAPVETAPEPEPAVDAAEPEGAAVLAGFTNDMPSLQVYFDTGATRVADEFEEKAARLLEHMKNNPGVTAVISGFNDPTGDAQLNARLSKGRAEAVQQRLVNAGIAKERTLLEKPAETTGTAVSNAASRRVEVILR